MSGFLHSFIAEVFAMVRAHVAALGGNAVVSYSMKECVFMENPNKNQVHTQTFLHQNVMLSCQVTGEENKRLRNFKLWVMKHYVKLTYCIEYITFCNLGNGLCNACTE